MVLAMRRARAVTAAARCSEASPCQRSLVGAGISTKPRLNCVSSGMASGTGRGSATLSCPAQQLDDQHRLVAVQATTPEAELAAHEIARRTAALTEVALFAAHTLVDGLRDQCPPLPELACPGREKRFPALPASQPVGLLLAGPGVVESTAPALEEDPTSQTASGGAACRPIVTANVTHGGNLLVRRRADGAGRRRWFGRGAGRGPNRVPLAARSPRPEVPGRSRRPESGSCCRQAGPGADRACRGGASIPAAADPGPRTGDADGGCGLLMESLGGGQCVVVSFDEIDHTALMGRLWRRVGDRRVLSLVKAFLKAGLLDEAGINRETITGTPQGGILSRSWPTWPCQPSTTISSKSGSGSAPPSATDRNVGSSGYRTR